MSIAFLAGPPPAWLPLVLFGAVAVGLSIFGVVLKRRRAESLKQMALSLGLSYDGREWGNTNEAPQLETPLFVHKPHSFLNIMSGRREGLRCSFFDFLYGVGRQQRMQTVAAFTQAGGLPAFQLAPQDLLHRLGDAVLHKEIHIESDPGFDRRFRLTSADPDKARELFTPAVLSFFDSWAATDNWHVEGFGKTLVIFRPSKKVGAGDFRAFVEDTSRLAAGFFSAAGLKKAESS